MKRVTRSILLCLMLCLVSVTASGCGGIGFTLNPQELYSLPQLPTKYDELNTLLGQILEGGAEYAAPVSGANMQVVQMVDLDDDGQEEAMAFFRNSADEKPLKIYIFAATEESYRQLAVIENSGTGIYSIDYSDLDGDGRRELLVGWRVSTDMQVLSVYSLRRGEPEELVRTNYVKYARIDLNEDGRQELVVLRTDNEGDSIAEYYGWSDEGGLLPQSTARLSMTMAELSQQGRVKRGVLRDEVPALFVTGVAESAFSITDILTVKNGELANVVLSDATGVSSANTGFYSLYPSDINNDGLTEVPWPVYLPAKEGMEPGRRIEWRCYDSGGQAETVMSTYHDVENGWYLQLPEVWQGNILASRSSTVDESTVTFSIRGQNGEEPQDFLKISTLTGSSRESRAVRGNRFSLSRRKETIYVAELLEANSVWEFGITEDEVRASFSLIAAEWIAGDN